jgi:arginine/ornithine transport system permease protein
VPKGQLEAGHAYGLTSLQVFRRILLPQMIRHALPSFGNNWLVLIKATALLSAIQLEDMVRKARLAAGSTHEPFNFFLFLAVIYLVITAASTWLLELARRRYSVGTQR